MKVIRLYGRLAKFLGRRRLEAEVATPAEAVRFLLANFPRLESHMADQHYKVKVADREIEEGELHHPSSDRERISIIPVVAGAGVVGRIFAGAALIALSVFTGGFGGLAIGGLALGTVAVGVGASLVLGGVAQLLTPVPQAATGANSEDDPRKSYSFSGVQNVSRQGVPVPICYGEVLVGSIVISAGIDINQVAT